MKRIAIAAVVLSMLLLAGPVYAQEGQDLHWEESPMWGTWSFNAGIMFFTEDDYQDIYGDRGMVFYNMNTSLKLIHELELIGSMGYGFAEGRGISPTTREKTNEWYKLHIAPAGLGLVYRFNFVLDQPLVPYVGGSGILSYWFEEKRDSGWKRRGYNWGAYGNAGLMLLLDNLERRASGSLESAWGINNTYLFYEYRYTSLDDFGQDEVVNLSSHFHSLGLAFEF